MTDTENYLTGVYYAERDVRQLCCKLADYNEILKRAYDGKPRIPNYGTVIQKTCNRYSVVEETAIKICDQLREKVDRINAEIAGKEAIIADVKQTVENAGLNNTEKEYIKFRYFQNIRSRVVLCRKMFCSNSSIDRTRLRVLNKVDKVRYNSF